MNRRRGFTLIELLVVIGIMAILMMLVVPQLGAAMSRAKEVACRSNLKTVSIAALA